MHTSWNLYTPALGFGKNIHFGGVKGCCSLIQTNQCLETAKNGSRYVSLVETFSLHVYASGQDMAMLYTIKGKMCCTTRPGLSLVAPRRANMRRRDMIRADGGEAGGEKRQCADSLRTMHMHDFAGFRPEIVAQSQRKMSVQYEPNINHISKNNIPAAPLSSAEAPSPFL